MLLVKSKHKPKPEAEMADHGCANNGWQLTNLAVVHAGKYVRRVGEMEL